MSRAKPDFSGDYVLDREASSLSAAGAAGARTATLRIEHDDPRFHCAGKFDFGGDKPMEWALELTTDGPELAATELGVSLRWDGDSLVFLSREEAMTLIFRYELGADGRLRMSEQLRGTDHDQDNVWVFERADRR